MTDTRARLLAARLADARRRYAAARANGDADGADYARAEARRLRGILEG